MFCPSFPSEGSRVRVKRGPLRGIEGFLVRVQNQTRLVLSVEMLSQSIALEIGIRDVEACRPQRASRRLYSLRSGMYYNLKLQLWKSGIRQNRLAQLIGIDETQLSRMVNGFREPD